MAIMDTGLGWEADDNYLKQYAGKIGSISYIGGTNFPGQPLPTGISTYNDVVSRGMLILTYTNRNNEVFDCYAAGESSAQILAAQLEQYTSGVYSPVTVFISKVQNAYLRIVTLRRSNGVQSNTIRIRTGSSISGTSFWRVNDQMWNPSVSQTLNAIHIPTGYADYNSIVADISEIDQNITKADDGYCAVCWVNYQYNVSGNTRSVPIMISSVEAYQEFGETYAGYLNEAINYQGMFFYFSIPYDIQYGTPFSIMSVDLTGTGVYTPVELFHAICRIASIRVTAGSINPYTDPDSAEAGGGGTDPEDDEVPLEPVTFPSALGTGFCRLYCPSAGELLALSDYLWGPLFDLNNVKRLFADPMDSILGLSVVPLLISGTSETVSVAGVSTGISLPKLSVQHINVDLGSLQVTEKWGAYLDYEPYTKYSIYLPFIGYRTVSADDIMGKWVHLTYDIDLLSGACVAKLVSGSTLLYQWAGTCAMQLPVNAGNWNSVIQSTIATIGSVATGIASGGAAAPMVAGALSSAAVQATQMKPSIERAGGLSGAAAFLSGRRAYMIRTYPNMVNPGNQQHYIGYPSFITKQLGNVTGYNVVADIHLEGIPATQTELEEIDTLLHEGVIL